eukprot:TRINITY_DN109203_c0_g1_i1.p1 TRINITY_DN109203_c0_g1~~TRINITY_DN109203_c0_g1_i1.p1  ORF type:complete len:1121 (+),score=338.44 TRINITY_DN109203_c0_g1_i1:41-3364(+)
MAPVRGAAGLICSAILSLASTLVSGVDDFNEKIAHTFGISQDTIPQCAQSRIGYDDPDHPELNGGFVLSAGQCQKSCSVVWYCEVFTYYPNSKACWLQGSNSVAKSMENAISGPKTCSEPAMISQNVARAGQQAASNSQAFGKDLTGQVQDAGEAVKQAARNSGLTAAQTSQLIVSAAAQVAADAAASSGKNAQEQTLAAITAAKKAAVDAGLSEQMQQKETVKAAVATALHVARLDGKSFDQQVDAAVNAAKQALPNIDLSTYDEGKQVAAAAASAAVHFAIASGKSSQEVSATAANAAKKAAADVGLTTQQQSDIAIAAAGAAAAHASAKNGDSPQVQAAKAGEAAKQTAALFGLDAQQRAQAAAAAEKSALKFANAVASTTANVFHSGSSYPLLIDPSILSKSIEEQVKLLEEQMKLSLQRTAEQAKLSLQHTEAQLGLSPGLMPKCATVGTGYDDPDHKVVNGGYVANANICQDTCSDVWYCDVFTYHPDTKACWLQGSNALAKPMATAVSGPSKCGQDAARFYSSFDDAVDSVWSIANEAEKKAKDAGKNADDQYGAVAHAVKKAAANAGFSTAFQVDLASAAVGQLAADSAKVAGMSSEQQISAAVQAATDAAAATGMTSAQQSQQAAVAAAVVAANAAKGAGKGHQEEVDAAYISARSHLSTAGVTGEDQALETARAVTVAAAMLGQSQKEIEDAAEHVATDAAVSLGLLPEQQQQVAHKAREAAAEASTSFNGQPAELRTAVRDVGNMKIDISVASSRAQKAAEEVATAARRAGQTVQQQEQAAAEAAKSVMANAGLSLEQQQEQAIRAAGAAAAAAVAEDGKSAAEQTEAANAAEKEYAAAQGISLKEIQMKNSKAVRIASFNLLDDRMVESMHPLLGESGMSETQELQQAGLKAGIQAAQEARTAGMNTQKQIDVGVEVAERTMRKEGLDPQPELHIRDSMQNAVTELGTAGDVLLGNSPNRNGSSFPWWGWVGAGVVVVGGVAGGYAMLTSHKKKKRRAADAERSKYLERSLERNRDRHPLDEESARPLMATAPTHSGAAAYVPSHSQAYSQAMLSNSPAAGQPAFPAAMPARQASVPFPAQQVFHTSGAGSQFVA